MPRNNRNNNRRSSSSSTKRVRIDDTIQEDTTSPTNNKISPTSKAKLEFERAIASHPMDMQTLMKTIGIELLTSHTKYFNKKNMVQKMEDEQDYIPRSCRVKFNLDASEPTKKRAPQRVQQLTAQAQEVVNRYQTDMKQVIIASCKEEKTTLREETNKLICEALYKITRAHIVSLGKTIDTTQMVMNLLEHTATEKLLKHTINLSTAQLKQLYKTVHSLENLPAPTELAEDHEDPAMQAQVVAANNAQWALPEMETLPQLLQLLESTIYLPYETFLVQNDQNRRLLELRKVSNEIITNEATDATAMLVDNETPLNAQQMQDVIKQEVKKATQTLQQQLSQQNKLLQQALQSRSSSKNNQRGQSSTRSGASNKKKSKGTRNRKDNTNSSSRRGRQRSLSRDSRSSTSRSRSRFRSNTTRSRNRTRPNQNNQDEGSVGDSSNGSRGSRSSRPNRNRSSRRSSNRSGRHSNTRRNR